MPACRVWVEIKVVVQGDFLPTQLLGRFHLFFATLRCFYLALWMFFACPNNFDVILVDQISFSIPILKKCGDKVLASPGGIHLG